MEKTKKNSYSHTVFLPRTAFSMRAELTQKEPVLLEFWKSENIYFKIIEKRKNNKTYVLHDGPPYANGHIHIGHALNKILKDFVIKSYSIMGYYTPFMPGWDCHGLPIEQQLLKELKISKRHIDNIVEFRRKARDFASKYIDIQKDEFKRLGIFADWENPYITMSNDYEATVVKAFIEMFEKGYIQRDKKTIYWCPVCETALADAEVEYHNKVSHSIFVKFKVKKNAEELSKYKNLYIVIWTTTPWTLPANMAAAVNKDEKYAVLENNGEYLIVAEKLVDYFSQNSGLSLKQINSVEGKKLLSLTYEPVLIEYLDESLRYDRKVIYTDFVDMTTGSGIVHIAPGHGEEDYHAGKKWGLEVFCPVKEDGRFYDKLGNLSGKFIFEANKDIIEILKNKGLLISEGQIEHSYPHCWRCKNPIIFRATEQWFLKVDTDGLREKLIDSTKKVKWIPKTGEQRISSMLKLRPDWCLSRQRYWGTPIISFYCKKCGEVQKDFDVLYSIQKRIEREGSDFWFSESIKDILPAGYKCKCGSDEFEKEKDILDVWLDSGVSWYAVCKNRIGTYPVDLYLEGSDQHRGWFQTSLIPSMALNNIPPYKTVLTHGFVLDEQGRAMHKSLGNVVSPFEVIKKYGAEILRLWVALSDYNEDVRISEKLLAVPIDMYRKIRNTFRYLLGNLNDFKTDEMVDYNNMLEIDKYILHRLQFLNQKVKKAYEDYEYRNAIRYINDFCINELSSFYLDALKDRIYTYAFSSVERKSAQTAMYEILKTLLVITSPVLSFTSEEAWQVFKKEVDEKIDESVFLSDWPEVKNQYINNEIADKWTKILSIREKVLKEIEGARKNEVINSSLEAKVIFNINEDYDFLKDNIENIKTACIVSQVEINNSGENSIVIKHAEGEKCPRCWQWSVDIGRDNDYPEVCPKCADAMKKNNV